MIDKDTLLVVDGYGFIFRAYHIQPSLTTNDGQPIGAVYGFTSMLLKLLNDFSPRHILIAFDSGNSTFRHKIYEKYKSHRPEVPHDLIQQFSIIRCAARSFNIPIIEKEGYEADDIIATLAHRAKILNQKIIIVSSDKDLMQLIDSNTMMYDPVKNQYISTEDVVKKFAVYPHKLRDFLALVGDNSDNIPGVPNIGVKTAAKLINQFGSLTSLLNNLDQVENLRCRNSLVSFRDLALISWELVGLDYNVELGLDDFSSLKWIMPDSEKISNFLVKYNFQSLYKRVEHLFKIKINHNTVDIPEKSIIYINALFQIVEFLAEARMFGIILVSLTKSSLNITISNKCYVIHNSLIVSHEMISLFKDKSIKKITDNIKDLLRIYGECVVGCEDLHIMQYILNAGKGKLLPLSELQYEELKSQLITNKLYRLYKEIDLPLSYIIYKMETVGVKLDADYLRKLSEDFNSRIAILQSEIFNVCGVEFNIASTKQLGEVLFDKMQLPFGKKSSKVDSYSTSSEILEKLSHDGYYIADLVLKWRQLNKLITTYTNTLPNQINFSTSRVHSTFLQTSTSTGRLSSQDPNLQNIPIKSEDGNKIRAAFIASSGCKLISADYSQIELRILSHVANVSGLKEAFLQGEDIHVKTASRIFKIPQAEVSAEHRRKAKAINFGIIYGISSFGLSKQLSITVPEASEYINKYFVEYPEIKYYMDNTINYAKKNGYVRNLFGRKCFVPMIHDKNPSLRHFAERAAINAPIQGTNADIIKLAMINLDKVIKQGCFTTKIILQIHDELLLEVPDSEVNFMMKAVKQIMEEACVLSIPTVVEINVGNNWLEIH